MLRQLCPRGIVAVILGVVWMSSVVVGAAKARPRAVPCPNEDDILPCVCTSYPDFSMDMDCSAVTSSNQLAIALNADLPFLDFNHFLIRNNSYITTLRVGDLGKATFERIIISGGILETVVEGALVNSYDTLISLDLSNNFLLDFPFSELSSFRYLEEVYFQDNMLNSFPHIYSLSLRILVMGYNPIGSISSTALMNLTNLEEINLASAQLTSLEPGTFTGLARLHVVHLEYNYLTTLRAFTIHVTGPSNIVHLNNNGLTNIEVGAIEGANYQVWVNDNELTELTEDVWGPMFNAGIRLSSRNNPFICGCDIAWIVIDVSNLVHLVDDPTCESGQTIMSLDPSIYIELCT